MRWADDFIVRFQHRDEAMRFLDELLQRLAQFGLELHARKARLIEFDPFAAEQRRKRSQGKLETFDFLGFAHICGKKRSKGRFTVLCQTMRKRLQGKLQELKFELRRRLQAPIPEVGQWLRSVLLGHMRCYRVPMNAPALHRFRFQLIWFSWRSLKRRSQKSRVTWERMKRYAQRWLPPARICHSYLLRRMGVIN